MNGAAWFFNGIGLVVIVTFSLGLYKLFEKAEEEGWKAIVPVYNWLVWLKLIGKPVWWVALLFIPVVNILVLVSMVIDLCRAYGQHDLKHHAAALLLPFYYFPKVGFDPKVEYLGPPEEQKNLPPKTSLREWGDAILFAGVAALIIRTFFVEAFMIPTSSMERTLMAGDFLFVSKFHYGSRMPMTPAAVPFVHNKIKIGNFSMPSYIGGLQLPYYRTPGLTDIKRNDIVVFNYPAHDIHDLEDGAGKVKPVSMKENYIKRCIGMPGDSLEIRERVVYINGEKAYQPPLRQFRYQVDIDQGSNFVSSKKIPGEPAKEFTFPNMEEMGFRPWIEPTRPGTDVSITENYNWRPLGNNSYEMNMPPSLANEFESIDAVRHLTPIVRKKGNSSNDIYPKKPKLLPYNVDWYGPMLIPAAGLTVDLTAKNLALYQRVITAYEGHELEIKGNTVRIDGQETKTYTFEMNYYWMMGDNRHNSQDSRYWGFVPENHVVGKPLFVFFSYESAFGIRWNRIGTKYVR
ncbi:MAG: signal peptidase I [Bacteroidota bacterium]